MLRAELDSHAEMCVIGNTALVIYDFGRTVQVSGYDPSDISKNLKIVSAAVAFDLFVRPTIKYLAGLKGSILPERHEDVSFVLV